MRVVNGSWVRFTDWTGRSFTITSQREDDHLEPSPLDEPVARLLWEMLSNDKLSMSTLLMRRASSAVDHARAYENTRAWGDDLWGLLIALRDYFADERTRPRDKKIAEGLGAAMDVAYMRRCRRTDGEDVERIDWEASEHLKLPPLKERKKK